MKQIPNIRLVRLNDLPDILSLYVQTVRKSAPDHYREDQIEAWTSSVENRLRWEEAIREQIFLVARLKQKISGFGSLKNGELIDFLYVDYDVQRKGVATALYQQLERQAVELEKRHIFADVSRPAMPFFNKQGFRIIKKNLNTIKGVIIPNYRMQKILEW